MEKFWALIGALVANYVDHLWWKGTDFTSKWEKTSKFFDWFEHYHNGMLMIIFGVQKVIFVGQEALKLFSIGFGLLLILEESQQAHPFAKGSGHMKESALIGVGIAILGVMVIVLL